ncbi:DNA replication protein [Candidatus Magnetoovum chiemensis]|nr:DNA replication protein [Candidatus Magnetoovum chiemensis]
MHSGSNWRSEIVSLCAGDAEDIICKSCGEGKVEFFNPFTFSWRCGQGVCGACRLEAVKKDQLNAVKVWKDNVRANILGVLRRCSAPKHYLNANKSSVSAAVWSEALCVLEGFGLFIFGPSFCGKTYLAVCVLCEFVLSLTPKFKNDWSVVQEPVVLPIFVSVADMLLELRDAIGKDRETDSALINSYCDAPLLVLDDLGSEKPSQWTIQTIYTIVNKRFVNNLPTIITSNIGLKTIEDNYNDVSEFSGTRIVARITRNYKIININNTLRRKV